MCKSKCSHCKRKSHHVSVCYKLNSEESEDEETVEESSSDEANLLNANKSNNVSVLPTARVKVKCKDGSWQPVTLLFDSGADRSYVSKNHNRCGQSTSRGRTEVQKPNFNSN